MASKGGLLAKTSLALLVTCHPETQKHEGNLVLRPKMWQVAFSFGFCHFLLSPPSLVDQKVKKHEGKPYLPTQNAKTRRKVSFRARKVASNK